LPIIDVHERGMVLTICDFAHFQARSTSSRTTRRARCRAAPDARVRPDRESAASGYCGWYRWRPFWTRQTPVAASSTSSTHCGALALHSFRTLLQDLATLAYNITHTHLNPQAKIVLGKMLEMQIKDS